MLAFVTNLYPYPDHPGRGLYNRQLVDALRRAGEPVTVDVLVASSNPAAWGGVRRWQAPEHDLNVQYHPYAHVPVLGRSRAARHATHALCGASLDQADEILGSWLYPDGVAACAWARRVGRPGWMMALGSDRTHFKSRSRCRQILEAAAGAAGVICVAESLAVDLAEAGVPESRLFVVRNGVDTARFHPQPRAEATAELAAQGVDLPAGRRILFLGNLVDVKAPDVAIAVMARLIARGGGADVHGVIAGDGPLYRRLAKEVDRLGLSRRVHILGRQPHARVPALLNACDLLLLPSRSEGMPNVVAEARACGIPVVATDVGLCRTMLAGHEACSVAPADDVPALTDAVETAFRDMPVHRSSAFTRSWDDMASEMLALMR